MTAQTTDPAALPPEGRALAQLLAGSQIRIAQARLAAERRGNIARAEAVAHYERAAALAVRMGAGGRVTGNLSKLSAAEIESMALGLEKGLDVLAVQQVSAA